MSSSSDSEYTLDSESSSSSESEVESDEETELSSEEESDEEMELFRQAGISDHYTRHKIRQIKNNAPGTFDLEIEQSQVNLQLFANMPWELLGRYIANNTHLQRLTLSFCDLTEEKMARLFGTLTKSDSIKVLNLCGSNFGIEGVRSMMPFLNSCSLQLSEVRLGFTEMGTECFELVVSSLHGTCIQKLFMRRCNITNISSLQTYELPNLQCLNLVENDIGREGCIIISNLLQKEGSTLTELYLDATGMGDEGAEILAASLKNNTKLKVLRLMNNNMTNRGREAILKLLVDVSSIESAYKSNHTLVRVILSGSNDKNRHIISAEQLNNLHQNSHSVGREKVIEYQLNSQTRKVLCQLQGIDFSYSNIFADIDPILLPNIIALISDKHGQSELYTALIPMAPDLLSYIDRKALIDRTLAKNEAKAAVLSHDCAQKVTEYEQKVAEYKKKYEKKMAALKTESVLSHKCAQKVIKYEQKVAKYKKKYEKKMAALKTELLCETSRLTAENNELINRRALIDVGDSKQAAARGEYGCEGNATGGRGVSRGKKRGRS